MERSKHTEQQIFVILKEGEADPPASDRGQTMRILFTTLVLAAALLAGSGLHAEEPARQSSMTTRWLEQAFELGFRIDDDTLGVALTKDGPVEGRASAVLSGAELIAPLGEDDPRIREELAQLDGDLIVKVMAHIDRKKVEGGLSVYVKRPDGSQEELRMRPSRGADGYMREGRFMVGEGVELIVASGKPYDVSVNLETRLTSRWPAHRAPKAPRTIVLSAAPGTAPPRGLCEQAALDAHAAKENERPLEWYRDAQAKWEAKQAERESCRKKNTDAAIAERGSAEFTPEQQEALESVLSYICDPGDPPTAPDLVELRLSESRTADLDGTTFEIDANVKAKPGLVLRLGDGSGGGTDFMLRPGHRGFIRCFVEKSRGETRSTLPIVMWKPATWRYLKESDDRLSDDRDSDLLADWRDPDADGDGVLDAAQRPVIEPGGFESLIRLDQLER